MNKSTGIILALAGFFIGMAVGFIASPVKKGIRVGRIRIACNVGCNNGANNTSTKHGRKKLASASDKNA